MPWMGRGVMDTLAEPLSRKRIRSCKDVEETHGAPSLHPPTSRSLSASTLWLVLGVPLVAFPIAAAPAIQSRLGWLPLNSIVRGVAGLLLQAIPFVLIGVLVSAAVETWVSPSTLRRHLPRTTVGGMAVALLAGLLLPVCDCVIVPTFAGLARRRLPLPTAVTFLCAAPVMNPVALWSTWYAFPHARWMVAARVGMGVAVALAAGAGMAALPPRTSTVRTEAHGDVIPDHDAPDGRATNAGTDPGLPRRTPLRALGDFLVHVHADFLRLMPIVLAGIVIAASLRTAMGSDPSSRFGGLGFLAAIGLMMAFAYVGSICSSSDAVIAASLAGVFPASAILAFLVLGPMLDVKNTLMLVQECHPRFTIRLMGTIVTLCLLAAVVAQLLLTAFGATITAGAA